jgi:hypothetical protein
MSRVAAATAVPRARTKMVTRISATVRQRRYPHHEDCIHSSSGTRTAAMPYSVRATSLPRKPATSRRPLRQAVSSGAKNRRYPVPSQPYPSTKNIAR